MEEIRIHSQATYSPIALTDLALAAPIVSRVMARCDAPGRVLRAAALGVYVGSAVIDWFARPSVRIDFLGRSIETVPKTIHDERMRLTGQNGLPGYDQGFTNLLYTFETSDQARQRPPAAGRLR